METGSVRKYLRYLRNADNSLQYSSISPFKSEEVSKTDIQYATDTPDQIWPLGHKIASTVPVSVGRDIEIECLNVVKCCEKMRGVPTHATHHCDADFCGAGVMFFRRSAGRVRRSQSHSPAVRVE